MCSVRSLSLSLCFSRIMVRVCGRKRSYARHKIYKGPTGGQWEHFGRWIEPPRRQSHGCPYHKDISFDLATLSSFVVMQKYSNLTCHHLHFNCDVVKSPVATKPVEVGWGYFCPWHEHFVSHHEVVLIEAIEATWECSKRKVSMWCLVGERRSRMMDFRLWWMSKYAYCWPFFSFKVSLISFPKYFFHSSLEFLVAISAWVQHPCFQSKW